MASMRGLAKTSSGPGNIDLIDLETPTPTADEVLIEVDYAGLCGSDAGIYKSKPAFDRMSFPTVIGHEYTGKILETGRNVTHFSADDRVVERPIRNCGVCYQCSVAQTNICQNAELTGIDLNGAYAGYITAPEGVLQLIPDDIDPRHAALAEPTAVGTRAVIQNSRVRPGDSVLVAGPGPIGLLTAQIASAQGGEVLVAGVARDAKYRLPLAEKLGLKSVNIEKEEIREYTNEIASDGAFDVVFDATGHPSGLELAIAEVRKGGQIVMVGQTGETSLSFTPLFRSEIDLQCTYSATYDDFDRAIKLMKTGDVDQETLIDERFDLLNPEAAFEAFLDGETCKPVFDVSALRQ